MKKLGNKGFTLVELLAVLVILIAIMGIAIPTISSSLERTKAKQNEARYQVIESAAEFFVSDNKNSIYSILNNKNTDKCYILVSKLNEYISKDERFDTDGNSLSSYYVLYTRPNTYEFKNTTDVNGLENCAP